MRILQQMRSPLWNLAQNALLCSLLILNVSALARVNNWAAYRPANASRVPQQYPTHPPNSQWHSASGGYNSSAVYRPPQQPSYNQSYGYRPAQTTPQNINNRFNPAPQWSQNVPTTIRPMTNAWTNNATHSGGALYPKLPQTAAAWQPSANQTSSAWHGPGSSYQPQQPALNRWTTPQPHINSGWNSAVQLNNSSYPTKQPATVGQFGNWTGPNSAMPNPYQQQPTPTPNRPQAVAAYTPNQPHQDFGPGWSQGSTYGGNAAPLAPIGHNNAWNNGPAASAVDRNNPWNVAGSSASGVPLAPLAGSNSGSMQWNNAGSGTPLAPLTTGGNNPNAHWNAGNTNQNRPNGNTNPYTNLFNW